MAKVFLSYDRDDTERARPVALALEKAGHTVWWDLHIRGGEQYTKVIDEALKAADAVVVLWSKYSVESAWVRDEAAAGRDSGRLVPVSLDDTDPPLGFRQFQTIDLSRWRGRGKPAQLQSLLADVEATARVSLVSQDSAIPLPTTPPQSTRRRRQAWPLLAAVAVVVLVAALVGWLLLRPSPSIPTVAVEASDASAASQSLAHELFVKLGSLQASNSGAVQLVSSDSDSKPSLIFEVAGNAGAAEPNASLLLLNGQDRSLFWSREFTAPTGHAADLKQQLGYTAARIVGCAEEGLNTSGKRLGPQTLKLYLNACAEFAETSGSDSEKTVPMFRQVTRDAPTFSGGWAGLLLAETELFLTSGKEPFRDQLRKDVAAARKINPDLVEIYQAEIDLLPYNAFAERMRLANRAVERAPNKPLAYATRAGVLLGIGRMNAAVHDAEKAVQLDPLSPSLRDAYIQTLLYSGLTDAALEELKKAERLWPGASNVALARFRIDLRYGDAGEALRVIRTRERSTDWMAAEPYLEARIDPSPAKIVSAIKDVQDDYRRDPSVIGHLAQVYGEFGREKELLDFLLSVPKPVVIETMDIMFRPQLIDFWNDPRSLLVAKRVGLLQYWQSSGQWPDFCFDSKLPYDCKKEAARLLA